MNRRIHTHSHSVSIGIRRLLLAFLAVSALQLLPQSCSKGDGAGGTDVPVPGVPASSGTPVSFTARSGSHSKAFYASYSGGVMDWSVGDTLRIWYPQRFSVPKWADYLVSSTSGGKASISPAVEGGEIKWNYSEDTHSFYAVYPAPTDSNGGDLDGDKLTVSIPAVQIPLSKDGLSAAGDTVFVVPDHSKGGWLYANIRDTSSQSSLSLKFLPRFTAVTVILNRGKNAEVTVHSFKVSSSKYNVSGKGTIPHASPSSFSYSGPSSAELTVAEIRDLDIVLSGTKRYVALTLFVLPNPYGTDGDAVSIHFSTTIGGATTNRRLELRKSGSPYVISPFSKCVVKNLSLPEKKSGLDVVMDDIILWDNSIDVLVDDHINWDSGILDSSVPDWIRWRNMD